MNLASVFNTLGQTVIPDIASKVFPDTMTIKAEGNATTGTGGGRIKGTATDYLTGVPVAYEATGSNDKSQMLAGDKAISTQQYILTFATHKSGSRINLDPKVHRLVVDARGNEPAKAFRIITIKDSMGVVFEAVCEREG